MLNKLNIYLSADAVMYLPIYVAKEKGIFSKLLPTTQVDLKIASGDYNAIELMYNDNLNVEKNTYSMAIADPNAIKNFEEVTVIGALIGCPSFWAISKKNRNYNLTGKINKNEFSKIVHYDDNLITGYKIGHAVREEEGFSDFQLVRKLGEEFSFLGKRKGNIIITPDLLKVAVLTAKKEAYINFHFADETSKYLSHDYITTAIITSKLCLGNEDKRNTFICVIEAIQKAKSIIYSSKQIAKEILMNMNCIKMIADEYKKDVVDIIIDIINEDHIYPSDMNISEKQWLTTTDSINKNFSEFVDNEIVLNAERIIAQQYGITINETFAETIETTIRKPLQNEITNLQNEITNLQNEITNLQNKNKRFLSIIVNGILSWIKNKWMYLLLWPSVTYTILYFLGFCYNHFCDDKSFTWTHSYFYGTLATGFVVPLISVILQKKNK